MGIVSASIYKNALTAGKGHDWLEILCKKYPKRLSGSKGGADAIGFVSNQLNAINYAKVYQQEVMVPHWVRGVKEEAVINTGKNKIPGAIIAGYFKKNDER